MTPNFVADAQKEREEWLNSLNCTEENVDDDEKGEFVRLDSGAKVYIPIPLQSENLIY